jgi:hypothetical protein
MVFRDFLVCWKKLNMVMMQHRFATVPDLKFSFRLVYRLRIFLEEIGH